MIDTHKDNAEIQSYVPHAFIQTIIPNRNEQVIMNIEGVLVDLIMEMATEVYGKYVVYENRRKVLYVVVLQALYGMIVTYILWYNKLHSDLKEIIFELNPYGTCV